MPDPVDPTPVRVVARGGKHFVVDKHGKALKKQAGYATPEAASAVASSVNATWRDAKAERKSKGGPEITEAWSQAARDAARLARGANGKPRFDPVKDSDLGSKKPEELSDGELRSHYASMLDVPGHRSSSRIFALDAEAKRRGKPHLTESRVVGVLERIASAARLDEGIFDSIKHPRTIGGRFSPGQAVRISGGFTGRIVADHGTGHVKVRYDDTGKVERMHRVNVTKKWTGGTAAALSEGIFDRFKHPRGRVGQFTAGNLPDNLRRDAEDFARHSKPGHEWVVGNSQGPRIVRHEKDYSAHGITGTRYATPHAAVAGLMNDPTWDRDLAMYKRPAEPKKWTMTMKDANGNVTSRSGMSGAEAFGSVLKTTRSLQKDEKRRRRGG